MKVGDLVKWTYPEHEDHGVIVAVDDPLDGYVHVLWCLRPLYNGPYPSDNEYLEKVA